MKQETPQAITHDAPDLVTNNSATLEDILTSAKVSNCLLEKFLAYWQTEAQAVKKLLEAFTHLNLGYLQMDAIPREVRERYWVAEQQVLLFKQECERRQRVEN
jgi:hypothetical protein